MGNKALGFLIVILLAVAIYFGYQYYQANAQITDISQKLGSVASDKMSLTGKIRDLQDKISSLQSQVDFQQNTMDEMDRDIRDARMEAWTDYENMGSTLESLKTSIDY